MRVYKIVGVTLPLLGALIGGLLAHHGDQAYESDTGKTLSASTVRGDVIAGAMSGFMLAVIVTFLVLLVVSMVHKRRRDR